MYIYIFIHIESPGNPISDPPQSLPRPGGVSNLRYGHHSLRTLDVAQQRLVPREKQALKPQQFWKNIQRYLKICWEYWQYLEYSIFFSYYWYYQYIPILKDILRCLDILAYWNGLKPLLYRWIIHNILWMVAKSCATRDGSKLVNNGMLKPPINWRRSSQASTARFRKCWCKWPKSPKSSHHPAGDPSGLCAGMHPFKMGHSKHGNIWHF